MTRLSTFFKVRQDLGFQGTLKNSLMVMDPDSEYQIISTTIISKECCESHALG